MSMSPATHSALLSQALAFAEEAVKLDTALQLEEAYYAYWHSLDIICQVMDSLRPYYIQPTRPRASQATFFDSDSDSDPYTYGGLGLGSESSSSSTEDWQTAAEESDEGFFEDDEDIFDELDKLRSIYNGYRQRMLLLASKIQAPYTTDSSPSASSPALSAKSHISGCQCGPAAAMANTTALTSKSVSSF